MEKILIICTLLGGVVAIDYFRAKLPTKIIIIYIDLLKSKLRTLIDPEVTSGQCVLKLKHSNALISIKKRLESDFYMSGPRTGQFGKTREYIAEARHYRGLLREETKTKPTYYFTYWGWNALKEASPKFFINWRNKTEEAILQRFMNNRWIVVQLEDYVSTSPGNIVPTAITIRHTARAAHILLVIDKHLDVVSQTAWEIIDNWEMISINNGAKEFLNEGEKPSLWSSVYIYSFLNSLRNHKSISQIIGDYHQFQLKTKSILTTLEIYFKNQWKKDSWKFGKVPWQLNAPCVLAEIAPFFEDKLFVKNVYNNLLDTLSPVGRLKEPKTGQYVDASEYISSIRLAYGLFSAITILEIQSIQLNKLINWLIINYTEETQLSTQDLAFLYKILDSKAPNV